MRRRKHKIDQEQNRKIEEIQRQQRAERKQEKEQEKDLARLEKENAEQQAAIETDEEREVRQEAELKKLAEVVEFSTSEDGLTITKTTRNKLTGEILDVEVFNKRPHS